MKTFKCFQIVLLLKYWFLRSPKCYSHSQPLLYLLSLWLFGWWLTIRVCAGIFRYIMSKPTEPNRGVVNWFLYHVSKIQINMTICQLWIYCDNFEWLPGQNQWKDYQGCPEPKFVLCIIWTTPKGSDTPNRTIVQQFPRHHCANIYSINFSFYRDSRPKLQKKCARYSAYVLNSWKSSRQNQLGIWS